MDSFTWFIVILLFFVFLSFFIGSPSNTSNENFYPVSDDMINQVLAMFPDLDRSAVRRDLQSTGSVQATVENALAGKIRRHTPSSSSTSTSSSSKPSKITIDFWEAMLRNPTLREKRKALVQEYRSQFLQREKSFSFPSTSQRSKFD